MPPVYCLLPTVLPATYYLLLSPSKKRSTVVRVQRVTSFRKGIWQERCSPLTVQNLLELR